MVAKKHSADAVLRRQSSDEPRRAGQAARGASGSLTDHLIRRLAVLGLSERRAALQAGLSPDSVKEIIAGRRRPRRGTLRRIGRALGCELEGYAD